MALPRLSRGRAVVLLLVLGVVAMGLSLLPWARATVPTVLGEQTVTVAGSDAAPATTAAGLALLATGLALALGGRWVIRLAAAAAAALGLVLGGSALQVLLDPEPRVLSAAGEASGVRQIAGSVSITPWPYLVLVLGALVLVAAVLVARVPVTAASRRFERPSAPSAPTGRVRAMDDWDALGRGEDPTEREPG